MEQEALLFLPRTSHTTEDSRVLGSLKPSAGAVCSEENVTSQTFSIPGSYDLQYSLGLH